MKLLLVDDHPLFVEGLQYLLETYGFDVAGVAHDGLTALKQARELRPDMILMDIRMPGLSGIDTLKLIQAELPEIRTVMLTTSDDENDLYEAMCFGASGYLLKSTNARTLVNLLQGFQEGEALMTPDLAARILCEFSTESPSCIEPCQLKTMPSPPAGSQLTPRQMQILRLMAAGSTYRQAGAALGLNERTLKYHMGRIIEQLHLRNRSQVIADAATMAQRA